MSPRKPTRAVQLGVTDDDYRRMLAAQNGHCALCPSTPKTRRFSVDHDHATGAVRGLLCHRDNRNLPTWVTPAWLDSAFRYLVRHELAEAGKIIYTETPGPLSSPCWLWERAISSAGYGVIRYRGELLYAHRLMYHGMIQDGEEVHHRCEIKRCVNPLHLQPLTTHEHSNLHYDAAPTCKRGHPWTPDNTYIRPDGSGRRQCRACIKLRGDGTANTTPQHTLDNSTAVVLAPPGNSVQQGLTTG